jgi:hypothetical protein
MRKQAGLKSARQNGGGKKRQPSLGGEKVLKGELRCTNDKWM